MPRWAALGIRGRVVAWFLVLLLAALVASVLVLRQVGEARIRDQARADLAAAGEELRSRLVDDLGAAAGDGGLATAVDEVLRTRPARSDTAYLAFLAGEPYLATSGAPVALQDLAVAERWADATSTEAGTTDTPAGELSWLALPVVSGGEVVAVLVATELLAGQHDALTSTITTVSVVTSLVLAAAALLAWVAAGRALAPLRTLARTARSIDDGDDLHARLEVRGHDEVAQLATSFNGMLDRLEGAFDAQRRFLDDAGHELRTPITIVRGHVELLDEDPERRAEEQALVLDELDRMERLVVELRLLARAERPDFLELDEVDPVALVHEVGRKVRAVADRDWQVVADRPPSTPSSAPTPGLLADRQRLTQALVALVDNAVQVTAAGDRIEVGAEPDATGWRLWVADDGPGIAHDDLPTLFDRTGRTVAKRPGGTGLGLPIVAAIARAHGGEVSATSRLGAGTRIELVLPTAGRRAAGPAATRSPGRAAPTTPAAATPGDVAPGGGSTDVAVPADAPRRAGASPRPAPQRPDGSGGAPRPDRPDVAQGASPTAAVPVAVAPRAEGEEGT